MNHICPNRGEKKKPRKEADEWPANRVRIFVRCVVKGIGVGEVTHVAP